MNLKFQTRNGLTEILLSEKIKNITGNFKNKVISYLGTLPDYLTLTSKEVKQLMRRIVKEVQNQTKQEVMHGDLNDDELITLLSSQLEKENSRWINLSPLLIEKILDDFKLDSLFENWQEKTVRDYDLLEYFNFIVTRNIVDPDSLLNYYDNQDEYFNFDRQAIKKQDLYEFLTFLYPKRLELQKKVFETLVKLLGKQRVHIFFYDGTNFTFCRSICDPDHLDRLDHVIKTGLRQFGRSKNSRFDRVCTALGIIATDLEIPLFYTVFPGNEQEISHIQEDIRKLNQSLFNLDLNWRNVIVADAGLYSGDLIFKLAGHNVSVIRKGDGYILGRSINQVDQETRDWMLDSKGYQAVSTKRKRKHRKKKEMITMIKSRIVTIEVPVRLADGRKVTKTTRQKQVALYSYKRKHKAMETIEKNIDRALSFQKKPKKTRDSVKYAKIYGFNQQTGEVSPDFTVKLDLDEIEDEIKKAGHFLITTNETDWPDGKILYLYRQKNSIEQLIRTLKQVIKASPVYVYTYEHICVHFDLCTVSLSFLNYIREMIKEETGYKLSPETIQTSLKKFQAVVLRKTIYILPTWCEQLDIILHTFGINFEHPVITLKVLLRKFGVKMSEL